MKTEGQRLLCEVEATGPEIAERLATTKQTISHWRTGRSVPSPAQRAALQLAYGIPASAWDCVPAGDDDEDEEAPPARPKRSTKATTLEEVNAQIDQLLALQDEPGLVPSAKLKIADSMGKLLAIKARLERDAQLLEDRVVREHPRWRTIRAAILGALRPHPEALAAVHAALLELGESEDP